MSSGTYFPPAVKAVEIPKSETQTRLLGIPTVADRVAQAVAKLHLEPIVEPKFHEDSLWVPSREICSGGSRGSKKAMLASGLGD